MQGAVSKPASRHVVLVVDDERSNRALVRGALASLCEVVEAEGGRRALEVLAERPVDLVLLDVMMPEMNGFDTCRAIKERFRERFLPVLLTTALTDQEDRNRGLAAGADDFLGKPIDRRELILRITAFLRLKEQEEKIRLDATELREQEALIRSQLEQLHQLQSLKDDLFSLIVHDLRNPLAGILGFLELLQLQLADPALVRARSNAAQAFEAARRLRDLLEEVLVVQRLEDSKVPLAPSVVDVRGVLDAAAATLEGAARSREIGISVNATAGVSHWLDPTLVRRAVENLIANAIKFSPPRGSIEIVGAVAAGVLRIEVRDRGPGVSDAAKMRLFKKFAAVEEREHGGPRRGFGLGLHLVKLVATAHGGDTFIRDNEGGGSVFGLTLAAPAEVPR